MFQAVDATIAPVGNAGGIRVTYRLTPAHTVSGLTFRGDLGLDAGELRRIVVDRFGAQPAPGRAEAAAEVLTAQLAARGFVQARVTTAIETDARGRSTLRFDVAAGRRARVGKVSIDAEGLPPRVRSELDVEDRRDLRRAGHRTAARRGAHPAAARWPLRGVGARPADAGRHVAGRRSAGRRRHHDRARTARHAALRRRSDPRGAARRAGAGGARGVRRRGPARGLAAPDRAVPLPAGPLEGGRRLSPRRHAGRPRRDLHRHRRRGLPDRPRRRGRHPGADRRRHRHGAAGVAGRHLRREHRRQPDRGAARALPARRLSRRPHRAGDGGARRGGGRGAGPAAAASSTSG